ncbi:hypothetical protein SMICM17S_11403 [Streptomyces microflavus]
MGLGHPCGLAVDLSQVGNLLAPRTDGHAAVRRPPTGLGHPSGRVGLPGGQNVEHLVVKAIAIRGSHVLSFRAPVPCGCGLATSASCDAFGRADTRRPRRPGRRGPRCRRPRGTLAGGGLDNRLRGPRRVVHAVHRGRFSPGEGGQRRRLVQREARLSAASHPPVRGAPALDAHVLRPQAGGRGREEARLLRPGDGAATGGAERAVAQAAVGDEPLPPDRAARGGTGRQLPRSARGRRPRTQEAGHQPAPPLQPPATEDRLHGSRSPPAPGAGARFRHHRHRHLLRDPGQPHGIDLESVMGGRDTGGGILGDGNAGAGHPGRPASPLAGVVRPGPAARAVRRLPAGPGAQRAAEVRRRAGELLRGVAVRPDQPLPPHADRRDTGAALAPPRRPGDLLRSPPPGRPEQRAAQRADRDALLGPAPDPASSLRLVAGRCPGSALPLRRRPRGGGADRRSVVQGRRSAVPAADARPEADPAGPRPRPRRTALACLHGAQAARPGRALRAGPGRTRQGVAGDGTRRAATAVSDRP